MKKVLSIAGSDSSGGAGVQADIKTFSAFQCYSMNVITAITAQNTLGVLDIQNVSPQIILKQIDAIFEDLPPDGIKIGMLSNSETIHTVAIGLNKYSLPFTVLDPVMISKNGFTLLEPEAVNTLRTELLPLADMITPNIPEAETFCNMKIKTHAEMEFAAKKIYTLGASSVLIKGGHMENVSDDLFFDGINTQWFRGTRIMTKHTHGTGCTLSSAITASIALGFPPSEAIKTAKEYIVGAIENSLNIGKGCGPTNHFYKLWHEEIENK